VDDDAADGEEPDDDADDFGKVGCVGALFAVDGDGFEEFEGDVEVEDGGDTDWTEETDEDGLAFFLDLVDQLMQAENNW
jgi:hypothetical protein